MRGAFGIVLFRRKNILRATRFAFYSNLGGSLAALHVDKDHVRRGLGTLVCLALTKKLGEMGEDVSASVGLPNGPARRLFQRIGFEEVGVNYYLHNKTDDTVKIKWSQT